MTADDGFPTANVDVGYFSDDKVNLLWRRLGDEAKMCAALTIHQAVVLGSWGSGRRRTVAETLPLWLQADPDLVGHLMAVGMLDRQQKVPAKSWARHFGPAAARRAVRRESGSKGGKAPRKRPSSNAPAKLNPTGLLAGPSSPSSPTSPSVPPSENGRKARTGPEKVDGLLSDFQQRLPRPA